MSFLRAFFTTRRREREVNITDALFAIADSLESVSGSIDDLRNEYIDQDIGGELSNVAKALEEGLNYIGTQTGGE
jgi:hypothetical protein